MQRGGPHRRLNAPNPSLGRGILGEMPRNFPSNFNQNNSMMRPNLPNATQSLMSGNMGMPTGMNNMGNSFKQGFNNRGGPMSNPGQNNQAFIGNLLKQQQQQPQQQNFSQGSNLPVQNIRDTQLNIVNNLLRGVMSGTPGGQGGQGTNSGSILGIPFPSPSGNPSLQNNPARPPNPTNQQLFPPRFNVPPPGFGRNNNSQPIPSIFDVNANINRAVPRKRNAGPRDHSLSEPAVKRLLTGQFPPGGSSFIQNQPRAHDRPGFKHDTFKRSSGSRFSTGRRDSSGSNQSERSQSSNWQNSRARSNSSGSGSKGQKPASETNTSRPASVSSNSHAEEGDGDFSVTVDNSGRSISDRKNSKEKVKKSPFFCHTCNVECYNEKKFTEHMRSDFHKGRMEGLLNLTHQHTSHLQARMKAEAHLRNIEGKGDNSGRSTFCKVCEENFTGSVVRHRQTASHKMMEKKNWPDCSLCSQTFKSPQKFVKHMNSITHKERRAESVRLHGGDPDNLSEGGDMSDHETDKVTGDVDDQKESDGNKQLGDQFVFRVRGYFCELCNMFYKSQDEAFVHCQSDSHQDNYQKWSKCHASGESTPDGGVWKNIENGTSVPDSEHAQPTEDLDLGEPAENYEVKEEEFVDQEQEAFLLAE